MFGCILHGRGALPEMMVLDIKGAKIAGVCACLPPRSEDNLARCVALYGDEKKAASVVGATGIRSRRVASAGVSSLDLCVAAAETLLSGAGVARDEIGAVICVTFTPERQMPCNACQAQRRLELPGDVVAFDIGLACSGWPYGLYVAATLANATGKKALLLDGDVQTAFMDSADLATVPVLADAGTATLVEPAAGSGSEPWRFSFMTDGAKGDALSLSPGGKIEMDGLGVFKFVTVDALKFIQGFMVEIECSTENIDAFVPHQANVFMVEQVAKKLGFARQKLWVSGDVFGNPASASIPVTIAHCGGGADGASRERRLLVAGFGGGLSASVGFVGLPGDCFLQVFDYGGRA